MTVKQLIEKLQKLDENKICVISDGEGWCNIEKLKEKESTINIIYSPPTHIK